MAFHYRCKDGEVLDWICWKHYPYGCGINMRPDFQITAHDRDITTILRERLLALHLSDEAGQQSDTVEISLDDPGARIERPRLGAVLAVSLGYQETGLAFMGRYTVDEVTLEGPPMSMRVRGKAADMRESLKAPKTRSWHNVTLASLIQHIAAEHGYEPRVDSYVGAIRIQHLDQTEESDLNLLTRIARQYDAIAKPAAQYLIFVPRGKGTSATGKPLPVIKLSPSEITSWSMTLAARDHYRSVLACWDDRRSAKRQTVMVGQGEPTFMLRHAYPDAVQAQDAAQAKLAELARGTTKLNLTLPGNPQLAAEGIEH
jgi:phage protein D